MINVKIELIPVGFLKIPKMHSSEEIETFSYQHVTRTSINVRNLLNRFKAMLLQQ
jgi:hypothetical protein